MDNEVDTPQTVQTGQENVPSEPERRKRKPAQISRLFWEIAPDNYGQWHWALWSGNGRIIARNAYPLASRQQAIAAIKAAKAGAAEAEMRVIGQIKDDE